jgi:hypothetical protein
MEGHACPLGQRMPSTCAWHPLFECNAPLSSTRQSRLNSIPNRRCRAAKSPLKAQDWQLGVCSAEAPSWKSKLCCRRPAAEVTFCFKIQSLCYEHGTMAAYIEEGQ